MLFLLASVPVLAAILAGSASLDTSARPRSPFVADAPQDPVVVPGDDMNPTAQVRAPVTPTPGVAGGGPVPEPDRPAHGPVPVHVGRTTRVESAPGGAGPVRPVAGQPSPSSSAAGSAMNPRGTPECSTPPTGVTSPSRPPSPAPRVTGHGGGGIVGIVGGIVGGLLG